MTQKPFDCVEYKHAIQQQHIAETQGMKPEQKTLLRRQWLKESKNPAAQLWREMTQKQEAAAVR
jgi:hypothetical protein